MPLKDPMRQIQLLHSATANSYQIVKVSLNLCNCSMKKQMESPWPLNLRESSDKAFKLNSSRRNRWMSCSYCQQVYSTKIILGINNHKRFCLRKLLVMKILLKLLYKIIHRRGNILWSEFLSSHHSLKIDHKSVFIPQSTDRKKNECLYFPHQVRAMRPKFYHILSGGRKSINHN